MVTSFSIGVERPLAILLKTRLLWRSPKLAAKFGLARLDSEYLIFVDK